MTRTSAGSDPLQGWDPRRRSALMRVWEQFRMAGASGANLSEELIAERRAEAATDGRNDPLAEATDRP